MKKIARALSYLTVALALVSIVGVILFYINVTWNGEKLVPVDGEYRVVKVLTYWLMSFGPVTVLTSVIGLYLARLSTRQTMRIRLWIGLIFGTISTFVGLVGVMAI